MWPTSTNRLVRSDQRPNASQPVSNPNHPAIPRYVGDGATSEGTDAYGLPSDHPVP